MGRFIWLGLLKHPVVAVCVNLCRRWAATDEYTSRDALKVALGASAISCAIFGFVLLYATDIIVSSAVAAAGDLCVQHTVGAVADAALWLRCVSRCSLMG